MKAPFIRALRALLPFAALSVLSAPLYAGNTTLNYNPAPTTSISNLCGSFNATCTTTAYFGATSLDTQNDGNVALLFQDAFNTWNASPTGGDNDWTLIDNVAPGGGTYNITTAAAGQFGGVTLGGLTINANLNGLTLPNLGPNEQLVWVQGLYINYTIGAGTIVAPYYTMDTSTLSNLTCGGMIFCPPAYPYQYVDNHFYDQPKDYYFAPGQPQAFFDADAYLAVENYQSDTVQLMDGFSYGFQNFVTPEPGTLTLLGTGLLGLAGFLNRKLAQRA